MRDPGAPVSADLQWAALALLLESVAHLVDPPSADLVAGRYVCWAVSSIERIEHSIA
jgi:hypothetical protein